MLQVNFRGSGGQGDAFVRAGYGEWGRKMQDDVTDATHWAIDNGMADPARIAIMGASYGGYASLMGVVREPALYRCAISISGVTDLKLFMTAGDIPDQRYGKSYLLQAIGDDSNEWKARSPLYQADKIKVPVLLISGTEDQRVPIEHSKRLEAALKQLNMPVETLYLPKEAHGFYRLKSREQLFERTLQFLELQLRA